MNLVKIRKSIVPATPPSKGGETFSNHLIYNSTLRLTAMGMGAKRFLRQPLYMFKGLLNKSPERVQ